MDLNRQNSDSSMDDVESLIIREIMNGKKKRDVALEHHIRTSVIDRILFQHGIKYSFLKKRTLEQETENKIIEELKNGKSKQDIATEFQVTVSKIKDLISNRGLSYKKIAREARQKNKGEEQISAENKIIEALKNGMLLKEACREFKRNESEIKKILSDCEMNYAAIRRRLIEDLTACRSTKFRYIHSLHQSKIIEAIRLGKNKKEVAASYNITIERLNGILSAEGINYAEIQGQIKQTTEQENELAKKIAARLKEGCTLNDLTAEFSISLPEIERILNERGTKYRRLLNHLLQPAATVHEKQRRIKKVLDPEIEQEILKDLLNGEKKMHVAFKFNISNSMVSTILFKNKIKYSQLEKEKEDADVIAKMHSYWQDINTLLIPHTPLEQAVISDLAHIAQIIKRRPGLSDVRQYGLFTSVDMRHIIGAVKKIWIIAGITSSGKCHYPYLLSKKEIEDVYFKYSGRRKLYADEQTQNDPVQGGETRNSDQIYNNTLPFNIPVPQAGKYSKRQIRQQQLLEKLKQLAEQLQRPPSKKDVGMKGYLEYYVVFGSWNEALSLAGLETLRSFNKQRKENDAQEATHEKKRLVEQFQMLKQASGRTPLPNELGGEDGDFKTTPYAKHFSSYRNLCIAAGMKLPFFRNGNYYTDEYLFDIIRRAAPKPGHSPSIREFESFSNISYMVLVRRFGGYNSALRAAGYKL